MSIKKRIINLGHEVTDATSFLWHYFVKERGKPSASQGTPQAELEVGTSEPSVEVNGTEGDARVVPQNAEDRQIIERLNLEKIWRAKRQAEEDEEEKKQDFLATRAKINELKNALLQKVVSPSRASGALDHHVFDGMDGIEFEHFIASVLRGLKYEAEVTVGSGDLGVDILASNSDGKFAIQVKRYNQPVSRRAISDAVAGRDHFKCDFAMVITNSSFTKDAKKLAKSTDCILIDRKKLNEWIGTLNNSAKNFEISLTEELNQLIISHHYWGKELVIQAASELILDYGLDAAEIGTKVLRDGNTENQSVRVPIGVRSDGSVVSADFRFLPPYFIGGISTGTRPAAIDSIMGSILNLYSPEMLKIASFQHHTRPPYFRLASDTVGISPADEFVNWAGELIERRSQLLGTQKCSTLECYNREVLERNSSNIASLACARLPYVVVIVEELTDFLEQLSFGYKEQLKKVIESGSQVGVKLILCSTKLTDATKRFVVSTSSLTRLVSAVPLPYDASGLFGGQWANVTLEPHEMLVRHAITGETECLQTIDAYDYSTSSAFWGKGDYGVSIQSPLEDPTLYGSRNDVENSFESFGDLPGRCDPLFFDALKCVVNAKRGSTSLLQRHLRIGYGRAAAILDAMVKEGYIGDMDGSSRARPVLQKAYEDLQDLAEMNNT